MYNRNTGSDSLYKDGLYMIDKGIVFLADNCILPDIIVYLNNILFGNAHTIHQNFFLSRAFRQTAELFHVGVELYLLKEDRRNI